MRTAPTHEPRVAILCGGLGTRMREETEFRPKPMVEVGGRPLLWHIMKLYGEHGFRDFVLCLGYRGTIIKDWFLDYRLRAADFTVDLRTGEVMTEAERPEDWRVTLADTGDDSMTGARLKRAARYLEGSDIFLCTYGDGLADVDITSLVAFHRAHGRAATVTGVHPPARFGQLVTSETSSVQRFAEKPIDSARINGGFFVFSTSLLDELPDDPGCVLAREPLERLAAEGELVMYPHDGFWQCADTVRDVEILRAMWDGAEAPWRVWDDRRPALAPTGERADRRRVPPLREAS